MAKKYYITEEQKEEIEKARKLNKDKNAERRLRALLMRAEGKSNEQIANVTEYHPAYVSKLVSVFCNQGLNAILDNHYVGNRRNMSLEDETAFIETYKKRVEQGQTVEISEMKKAYEEKVGHKIGNGQIYRVLKRQGWQKS